MSDTRYRLPLGNLEGYTIKVIDGPSPPLGHTWIVLTDANGVSHTFGFGPEVENGMNPFGAGYVYVNQPLPTTGLVESATYSLTGEQYGNLARFINNEMDNPRYYDATQAQHCTTWAWSAINAAYGLDPHSLTWQPPQDIADVLKGFLRTFLHNPLFDAGGAIVWKKWQELSRFNLQTWVKKQFDGFLSDITLSNWWPSGCPLILDLDGDGVELTSLSGTGAKPVYFDIDNDGFREASAWVKSDDGLLALDGNNNGRIDGHAELFGNTATAADGFAALKALDSNNDNKITSADTQYSKLRVWRDLNQDGVSQANELFTLAGLKITSISLAAIAANYQLAGNDVTAESTFVMNNQTRKIVDAWLKFDNVNTVYNGDYTLNPQALLLPQLRGYGALPDLAIAMSLKPALMNKVKQLNSLNIEANPDQIRTLVLEIMHLWANVENVDPYGRSGGGMESDARNVGFLEKFFDQIASDQPGGLVNAARGVALDARFHQIQAQLTARLLLQSGGRKFFTTVPTYNAATDSFSGNYQINFAYLNNLMNGKSFDYKLTQWSNLFAMLESTVGITNIAGNVRTTLDNLIRAQDGSGVLNFTVMSQIYQSRISSTGDFANDIVMGTAGDDNIGGAQTWTGNDIIFGLGGNDTLDGFLGDDVIFGGDGNDDLEGSHGADKLYGGNGDDSFYCGQGLGTVAPGDLMDGGAGKDTVISVNSDITLGSFTSVERLQVDGSVTLTAAQLAIFSELYTIYQPGHIMAAGAGTYDISNKIITGIFKFIGWLGNETFIGSAAGEEVQGRDGNDILKGMGGDDKLEGGVGNDTVYGGDGNDIITHSAGVDKLYGENGNDYFNIYGPMEAGSVINGGTGLDVIYAYHDISKASITGVERLETDWGVTLTAAQFASFLQFKNLGTGPAQSMLQAATAGTYDLSSKSVTGAFGLIGSEWSDTLKGNIASQTIQGGGGNDGIYGMAGNDTLDGGHGNDTIYGGAGNDIIQPGYSSGSTWSIDKMYGEDGNDKFEIHTGGLGAGSVIDGGAGTDVIVTGNSDLSKTTITGIERLETTGGTILSAASFAGIAQIKAVYYSSIMLHAANAGTYDLSTKTVTGTVGLTGSSGNDVLKGNAASQTIEGGAGNDTISGMAGNDTLNGGAGNDTVLGGDGNDTINSYNSSTTPSIEKLYGENGNDNFVISGALAAGSVISGGIGDDVIKAQGADLSKATITAVEKLDLVYGNTTISKAQFNSFAQITGAANTILTVADAGTYDLINKNISKNIIFHGSAGDDIITSNGGKHRLNGGSGNDTFRVWDVFQSGAEIYGGSGSDAIEAHNWTNISKAYVSGIEQLKISGGVVMSASQLSNIAQVTSMNGNSEVWLEASGAGTYDLSAKTVIGNISLCGTAGNETLIGNAASQRFLGKEGNDTLKGMAGNDTLVGGAGNDTLVGGTGNDTLWGEGGNDTYVFGRGEGADIVEDVDATSGNQDVMSILSGVARDQLWFTKEGEDLVMRIIGTNDKVTFAHWYWGADRQVETIKTATGNLLSNTKIQNLVNAMAGLSVPSTTTLSQEYHQILDSVIAANWT